MPFILKASFMFIKKYLFLQGFFYLVSSDHLFFESIGTSLRRLYHFNYFRITSTVTGFQGCNYFLCNSSII